MERRKLLDMGGSNVALPRPSKRLTVEINCDDSLHNYGLEELMSVQMPQRSQKSFPSQHIYARKTHCLQVFNSQSNHRSKNLLLANPRPLSVIPRGNAPENHPFLPLPRLNPGKVICSHSDVTNENHESSSMNRGKRIYSSVTPYTDTSIVGPMPIINNSCTDIVISTSKAPAIDESSEHIEDYLVTMTGYSPCITEGESSNTPPNGEPKILLMEEVDGYINNVTEPHSERKSRQRERSREVERLRKTRISEGIKAIQNIIPNSDKADKGSGLDNVIDYIKYLQLQMKLLSQRRLCGEATPNPFIHLEGYGHYLLQPQMSTEPLEDMLAQLIQLHPQAADDLLNSRGLTILPMENAYSLLRTI